MKIAVYTRIADPNSYTSYLGNSIHFAVSSDGIHYQALNQNYGMLFAKATLAEDNTIQAKGVKNPYIFRTEEGIFKIVAVRVNADGSEDEESNGKVLLWTSNDLIHFSEGQLVNLQKFNDLLAANSHEGRSFVSELTDIEGAVPGNVIDVEHELINELLVKWTLIENTFIQVPEIITASCREDVEAVKALAFYSDGSTVSKKVSWNTDNIDFSKYGTYDMEGSVVQHDLKFPLAIGYADPVVIKWEGYYYFISTNDNLDDKGLYVRKAATVEELFHSDTKLHLILDVDPSRQLIQTFWAPEFHVIGGELYILFAVGGEEWGPQCHMMKLIKGGDILNSNDWENPIRVVKKDGTYLATGSITLDMTYFSVEDVSYIVWSYRSHIGTPKDTGSMLYIATIDPKKPWILTSEPVLLSRPLFGWENNDQTINNEGPYPLITDKNIYITYSGGAACGYTYVLGLLTAKIGDDLLNVENWSKSSAPVLSFYSVDGEYGPGHNSFFKDDDGNTMIAYHAEEKLSGGPRSTGIRRVHFDKDGVPRFDMSMDRDLKDEFKKVFMKVVVENVQ